MPLGMHVAENGLSEGCGVVGGWDFDGGGHGCLGDVAADCAVGVVVVSASGACAGLDDDGLVSTD